MRGGAGPGTRTGLALLRKAPGTTSFQALEPVKRSCGTSKIGHAGTLDRFASGLLVALVGPYTRLAPFVTPGLKGYRALVRFGEETATLDPEGEVVDRRPAPDLRVLEAALPAFRGRIMQSPPAYSAIHVDGRRAYQRALAGERLSLPARPVEILELELEAYDGRDARLLVRCTAGTYVRSLARDLAAACGSCAHLAGLERFAIGPFALDQAVDAVAFDPDRDLRTFDHRLAASLGLGAATIARERVRGFKSGVAFDRALFAPLEGIPRPASDEPEAGDREAPVAVFDETGSLLGIVDLSGPRLRYLAVLEAGA